MSTKKYHPCKHALLTLRIEFNLDEIVRQRACVRCKLMITDYYRPDILERSEIMNTLDDLLDKMSGDEIPF